MVWSLHLDSSVSTERLSHVREDGIGIPSAFSIILGVLPSITATAEFVVPKRYVLDEFHDQVWQWSTYPNQYQ